MMHFFKDSKNLILRMFGLVAGLFCVYAMSHATTTMVLRTWDKACYYGYIQSQKPAEAHIIFKADSFVCVVSKTTLISNGDKYSIPLDGGSTIVPVSIQKDEGDSVIIKCNIAHTFTLKSSIIKEIATPENPKSQITGVNRIYTLYNGETITGRYAGEEPGKSISIEDSVDVIHRIDANSFERCRYIGRYAGETLYEQTPLLDRISTADGIYTGVVSELCYLLKPKADSYLFIDNKDGVKQRISIPAILKYEKIPNADYKPQYVNNIPEGRVAVNGQYAFMIPVSKDNFDKKLYTVLVPKDKTVTVKVRGNIAHIFMEIHLASNQVNTLTKDQFVLLHLKLALLRRYKIEEEAKFSVKPANFVERKDTHTSKYSFDVDATFIDPLKPGTYAIMDKVNNFIIPVFIQK